MHLALKRSNVRRIAKRHDRKMAEKGPRWTPAVAERAEQLRLQAERRFANVR